MDDNLEFNVELKNRSDYEFALEKFNELWEQAVEVSDDYVQTIEFRSPFAQFTPYELYLKFLYEYFKAELDAGRKPMPSIFHGIQEAQIPRRRRNRCAPHSR